MRSLSSENYDSVKVKIRSEEEELVLRPDKGTELMGYLTSGQNLAPFVQITDTSGRTVVIRVTEIVRVEPQYHSKEIDISKLEVPR